MPQAFLGFPEVFGGFYEVFREVPDNLKDSLGAFQGVSRGFRGLLGQSFGISRGISLKGSKVFEDP